MVHEFKLPFALVNKICSQGLNSQGLVKSSNNHTIMLILFTEKSISSLYWGKNSNVQHFLEEKKGVALLTTCSKIELIVTVVLKNWVQVFEYMK